VLVTVEAGTGSRQLSLHDKHYMLAVATTASSLFGWVEGCVNTAQVYCWWSQVPHNHNICYNVAFDHCVDILQG
jgi:hypothetical protein